jgi:hypothetical protein
MDATHSPSSLKSSILEQVKKAHSGYTFVAGPVHAWDPNTHTITYSKDEHHSPAFIYSLLHELGHAELMHNNFKSDLELLKMERSAWDKACQLANTFAVSIDEDHIEDCMDTYRDWLYARSLCPTCKQCGLQTSKTEYSCAFCGAHWKVNASRLCRVTRRTIKKSPQEL